MATLPPVTQDCCGTPCVFEDQDPEQPCWGSTVCVDYLYTDDGDEVRYATCEGHQEMWPSCDKTKYTPYQKKD